MADSDDHPDYFPDACARVNLRAINEYGGPTGWYARCLAKNEVLYGDRGVQYFPTWQEAQAVADEHNNDEVHPWRAVVKGGGGSRWYAFCYCRWGQGLNGIIPDSDGYYTDFFDTEVEAQALADRHNGRWHTKS
jgi:hypothetical protein